MVNQRAELFSVFLVIPTGFLRALASKQVCVVCAGLGVVQLSNQCQTATASHSYHSTQGRLSLMSKLMQSGK